MDWIKYVFDKEVTLYRISALIVMLIISSSLYFTLLVKFIDRFSTEPLTHVVIWLIAESVIILSWHINRVKMPKGISTNFNIIIAITAEDYEQRKRIKDFANELSHQKLSNGLDDSYSVKILNEHLSEKVQRLQIASDHDIKQGETESNSIVRFQKLISRCHGKLFIMGKLVKRNEGNNVYYWNISGLVVHRPTTQDNRETLVKEFSEVWKREMIILAKNELDEIKTNVEEVSFAAAYMLGLASLIDGRLLSAVRIWDSLETKTESKDTLKALAPKIILLKRVTYFLLQRKSFFQGDLESALLYKKKLLELVPDEYDANLVEATYYVSVGNDAELALEFIERAKKIAKGDGTWRYSMLYVLILLKQYKRALNILDELLKTKYTEESDTILQVITYNQNCLKKDSNHYQSNFIIGVLLYRKLNNPTIAYEKLEQFVKDTEHKEDWELLSGRAISYIGEMDKIFNISP